MFSKGITITIIFIVSTFVQLISQIVVTRMFGAKVDLEVFLAAVTIPTIVVTAIYSTLNEAFLPLLGKEKNTSPQTADSYFFSHLLVIAVASFLISWVLTFFTEPISVLFYGSRGEDFVQQVATQMRYLFYSFPLAIIATSFGSYLYAHKKFSSFPFAQAIGSVINLVLIILLAPTMGIWSLVVAFVLSILFQIVFIIPGSLFNFQFRAVNPLPLLFAWAPLLIGSLALRSDSLIIRSFGSQLPDGYLVHLNLISKIFSLATGVMTVGIQIVLLPHLVDFFHQKQYDKAEQTINRSKLIAIGVSVAVVMLITLFAPLFIRLLFVGGKFTQTDAQITTSLLPLFILPAIGWGASGIFFQPLLALKKQLIVGMLSVAAFILAWVGATVTNIYFGPLIAITSGLVILFTICILGSEVLWRYYKNRLMK